MGARLLRKNQAPRQLNRYRVGDIRHCFTDIGRMQARFGYAPPRRDFESGMTELIGRVRQARAPVDRSAQSLAQLEHGRMVA